MRERERKKKVTLTNIVCRQTDRQTNRHTNIQTGIQSDTPKTYRRINRQTQTRSTGN